MQQIERQFHHLNGLREYTKNTNRKKYVDFHHLHSGFSLIMFPAITRTKSYVPKSVLSFHDIMHFFTAKLASPYK